MKIPPVWILPNIWRLGQIRDTKFGIDGSKEMFLHATKCQSYIFYCFWVIKGSKILPPTQIRVKVGCFQKFWKKKINVYKTMFSSSNILSELFLCIYHSIHFLSTESNCNTWFASTQHLSLIADLWRYTVSSIAVRSGRGRGVNYPPVGGNRKFCWREITLPGWWKPEEEWFWRFQPFSKLTTAFCEY